jgi:Lar family restriction alleviation protein
MSEKLLPCPFCGSDQLVVKPNAFDGLLRVQCEGCWATSVTSNQKKVAVAAWNTRPDHAPEPTPDALEAANRRAEHYKHKKEIVATSRNRIAEGMEYWRERALLAESKMASPSTASSDEPVAWQRRYRSDCRGWELISKEFYDKLMAEKQELNETELELRRLYTTPAPCAATSDVARPDLSAQIKALEKERTILLDALQNMMGVYDTPVSRRRYPPDDFMIEALKSGRSAIDTLSQPRNDRGVEAS